MGLKLKYNNCVNCGAVVRGCKCAYCGTEYIRDIEYQGPSYPCFSGTYQSYATSYAHGSWTSHPRGYCGAYVVDDKKPDVAHEVIDAAANVVESILDLGC